MTANEQTLFSERLAEFSNGTVDAELTARLAELIKKIRVTGLAGSVTLTIKAAPDTKLEDYVTLAYKVSSKIPERPIDPDKFRSYGDGTIEETTGLRAVS